MMERPTAGVATGGVVDPIRCATGNTPDVLQWIRRPQLAVAVWQRNLPDSVAHPLAALGGLMPLQQTFEVSPDAQVEPVLDAALHQFGDASRPAYAAWRTDLRLLLALARDLGPDSNLRVRLETKADGGCTVFHVDHVALRLICTYRGQGTQWLPDGAFDRCGLGRGNNDHVRDWSQVKEVRRGHLAVMKGQRFPGGAGDALVHRSPPTLPAFPRLLCVIDIDLP